MTGLAAAVVLALGAGAPTPVSPAEWDALVRAHVRGAQVDYPGIAKERARLRRYLRALGRAMEPQGLWVHLNAYNALVVHAVLEQKVKRSVREVPDFFDGLTFTLFCKSTTLDALEKATLARFSDPRIHFALNCASRGCPPLAARAFNPGNTEALLEDLTWAFINGPGVALDGDGARLSPLFQWYAKDFEQGGGSVRAFLLRYLEDPAKRAALQAPGELRFGEYDWALNGPAPDRSETAATGARSR
jgi:hypothetical protein